MKTRRLVALVGVLALLTAACGDDDDDAADSPTTTAKTAAPTFSGPVKVGLMLEETGPLELLGKPSVVAARAAVDAVNKKGGIGGRPVQVELCDVQSLPERALPCYDELRRKDVRIIIGPIQTGTGQAILPLAQRDKVFFYPLSPSIVQKDIAGNPTVFLGNAGAPEVFGAMVDWMKAEGLKSVSMLAQAGATSESCKEVLQGAAHAELRKGIEVKGSVDFDRDAQTVVPQLANLPKADVLLSCSSGTGTLVNVAGWEETGLSRDVPVMLTNGAQPDSIAKAVASRVKTVDKVHVLAYCTIMLRAKPADIGSKAPECLTKAREFEAAVKAVNPGSSTDGLTATTWDAVMQALEAAAAVGDDPEKIAEHVEGLEDWAGAAGNYTFGPDRHRGLGKETIVVGHIENGVWVPVWTDNLPS